MTKLDIISGFLGAGKTALIQTLLNEGLQGEKLIFIEQELDGIGFALGLSAGFEITLTQQHSSCIHYHLVGDFSSALTQIVTEHSPARILIEPSGVGKLSDVITAVERAQVDCPALLLNHVVTVVDATKAKIYTKSYGAFFNNQVAHADTIFLSRTHNMDAGKLAAIQQLLSGQNPTAVILTTPWDQLAGEELLRAMVPRKSFPRTTQDEATPAPNCASDRSAPSQALEVHAQLDCNAGCSSCEMCNSCFHSRTAQHQQANKVFTSWGQKTTRSYSREDLQDALSVLAMSEDYGTVLRAKGTVATDNDTWLYFDLVPGEFQIRPSSPDSSGRLCVIGLQLKQEALARLFQLE